MFKRNSGWLLSLIMLSLFCVCSFCFWAVRAQDPPSNVRTDPPVATAQTTTSLTDLSGTYTGTFNCDVLGLTGPTTLTITGNDFTTAEGTTGRIVASTTARYTAVALQVGTGTDPTAAPRIVSLRARKSGNRLTLTSVAGAGERCSFVPGRGVARGRRNQPATPDATEPSAVPTTTPTESPMPEQTPSPMPSPTPGESPSPIPTPTPSPTPGEPMPTPSPGASPSPGEPMPTPSPGASPTPGEPMPTPSPGASPTPSPSPSPSPRR